MYLVLFEVEDGNLKSVTFKTDSLDVAKNKVYDMLIGDDKKLKSVNSIYLTEIKNPLVRIDKETILKEIEEKS